MLQALNEYQATRSLAVAQWIGIRDYWTVHDAFNVFCEHWKLWVVKLYSSRSATLERLAKAQALLCELRGLSLQSRSANDTVDLHALGSSEFVALLSRLISALEAQQAIEERQASQKRVSEAFTNLFTEATDALESCLVFMFLVFRKLESADSTCCSVNALRELLLANEELANSASGQLFLTLVNSVPFKQLFPAESISLTSLSGINAENPFWTSTGAPRIPPAKPLDSATILQNCQLQGYIAQQRKSGGYAQRFAILHMDKIYCYKHSNDYAQPKAIIELTRDTIVQSDASNPMLFSVVTGQAEEETYKFMCENEGDRHEWCLAIQANVATMFAAGNGERFRGYLWKTKKGVTGNFKRRFVVLFDDKLRCYEDHTLAVPKGDIFLSSTTEISYVPEAPRANTFSIQTGTSRPIYFAAAIDSDLHLWINEIARACEILPASSDKEPGVIFSGFMWKLGEYTIMGGYSRRFFRLYPNRLAYYVKDTDPKPRGEIPLSAKSLLGHLKEIKRPHAFYVSSTPVDRKFCLSCDNAENMEQWMQAIKGVIDELSDQPSISGTPLKVQKGYLLKTGSHGPKKGFERRYCILTFDRLQYFQSITHKTPKGEILLFANSTCIASPTPNIFIWANTDATYHFNCESAADRSRWIRAINLRIDAINRISKQNLHSQSMEGKADDPIVLFLSGLGDHCSGIENPAVRKDSVKLHAFVYMHALMFAFAQAMLLFKKVQFAFHPQCQNWNPGNVTAFITVFQQICATMKLQISTLFEDFPQSDMEDNAYIPNLFMTLVRSFTTLGTEFADVVAQLRTLTTSDQSGVPTGLPLSASSVNTSALALSTSTTSTEPPVFLSQVSLLSSPMCSPRTLTTAPLSPCASGPFRPDNPLMDVVALEIEMDSFVSAVNPCLVFPVEICRVETSVEFPRHALPHRQRALEQKREAPSTPAIATTASTVTGLEVTKELLLSLPKLAGKERAVRYQALAEWFRERRNFRSAVAVLSLAIESDPEQTTLPLELASAAGASMTRLLFRSCGLNNGDMPRVIEQLHENVLLEVDISGNLFEASAISALCNALHRCPCLVQLNISENRLDDELKSVADLVLRHSALEVLNLSKIGMGDAGAETLSQGLAKNRTLTELNLEGNKIGDVGIEYIAQALKQNALCQLQRLNATNLKFGDASVKDLLACLIYNVSLEDIQVHNSLLSAECEQTLTVKMALKRQPFAQIAPKSRADLTELRKVILFESAATFAAKFFAPVQGTPEYASACRTLRALCFPQKCQQLVQAAEGDPHLIQAAFQDLGCLVRLHANTASANSAVNVTGLCLPEWSQALQTAANGILKLCLSVMDNVLPLAGEDPETVKQTFAVLLPSPSPTNVAAMVSDAALREMILTEWEKIQGKPVIEQSDETVVFHIKGDGTPIEEKAPTAFETDPAIKMLKVRWKAMVARWFDITLQWIADQKAQFAEMVPLIKSVVTDVTLVQSLYPLVDHRWNIFGFFFSRYEAHVLALVTPLAVPFTPFRLVAEGVHLLYWTLQLFLTFRGQDPLSVKELAECCERLRHAMMELTSRLLHTVWQDLEASMVALGQAEQSAVVRGSRTAGFFTDGPVKVRESVTGLLEPCFDVVDVSLKSEAQLGQLAVHAVDHYRGLLSTFLDSAFPALPRSQSTWEEGKVDPRSPPSPSASSSTYMDVVYFGEVQQTIGFVYAQCSNIIALSGFLRELQVDFDGRFRRAPHGEGEPLAKSVLQSFGDVVQQFSTMMEPCVGILVAHFFIRNKGILRGFFEPSWFADLTCSGTIHLLHVFSRFLEAFNVEVVDGVTGRHILVRRCLEELMNEYAFQFVQSSEQAVPSLSTAQLHRLFDTIMTLIEQSFEQFLEPSLQAWIQSELVVLDCIRVLLVFSQAGNDHIEAQFERYRAKLSIPNSRFRHLANPNPRTVLEACVLYRHQAHSQRNA